MFVSKSGHTFGNKNGKAALLAKATKRPRTLSHSNPRNSQAVRGVYYMSTSGSLYGEDILLIIDHHYSPLCEFGHIQWDHREDDNNLFSHWLPAIVVSDNGSSFLRSE